MRSETLRLERERQEAKHSVTWPDYIYGNLPWLQYIQRVKIEAAKKKLEPTAKSIFEVMYDIGYNDEKAFRATFRKYSRLSPKAYQRKYNREMADA